MPESESVYSSLLSVAQRDPHYTPRQKDESVQDHLKQLVHILGGVTDELWAGLSEQAQRWYDSTLDNSTEDPEGVAMKEVLPIPEGFPPDEPAPALRRRVARSTTTVYDELLRLVHTVNASFAEKHPQETDNMYLSRLLKELPEDITQLVGDWCEAADAAQQQGHPLTLPQGYVAQDKPKKVADAAPVQEQPQEAPASPPETAQSGNGQHDPKYVDAKGQALKGLALYNAKLAAGEVNRRKRGSSKATADKPAKEISAKEPQVAKKRGRAFRPDTITARIRDAVTANHDITIEALEEVLAKEGIKTSVATITTTRAAHLAAIRSLQRAGWHPPTTPEQPAAAD